MSFDPWLPEHDEALKKYAEQHYSARAIALIITKETGISRTRSSIIGRAYRKGVKLTRGPLDGANTTKIVNEKNKKVAKKKAEEAAPKIAVLKQGVVPPVESFDSSKFVTLKKLSSKTCRFPVYMDGDQHIFCGHETKSSGVYCESHARACYQPPRVQK